MATDSDELIFVSTRPVNPVKADKPVQPVKADKVVKTDKPVQPVKPVNLVDPAKPKAKRLSRSKRTHVRRMKAEARKEGTVYRPGIE